MTRALITGITGQDGRYLTESLLQAGAEVHGLAREDDVGAAMLEGVLRNVTLHSFDLSNRIGLATLVAEIEPNEIFNLAGVSSVAQSWEEPVRTAEVNAFAVTDLLDAALRLQEDTGTSVRFLQASSAEIFGDCDRSPQDEDTPLCPTSPYGAAKAYAHQLVRVYRHRGLHATNAILYNHESPRRPTTFVTRKITTGVAAIAAGRSQTLVLGNLDAQRDWGWAPDYVDAMIRAARHDLPDDFIIATGVAHSVRDFVEAAFSSAGIDDWQGRVTVDDRFTRPTDAKILVGDPRKARDVLGWEPTVGFREIVTRMVGHDLAMLVDH